MIICKKKVVDYKALYTNSMFQECVKSAIEEILKSYSGTPTFYVCKPSPGALPVKL